MRKSSGNTGGVINLLFFGGLSVLFILILLDIFLVDRILEPEGYFYLFFSLVALLSLALNISLTGLFILWVKQLLYRVEGSRLTS